MPSDNSADENIARGNWSGKLDFILSCLGFAVGLGNVWRFPYLAYTYGGAVFLIPYAISLLTLGIPIFFLELYIGQFTSSGPLTCWKMAPLFQGLGAAMLVVTSILAVYYNVIIGWSIFYLIASFSALPSVPWEHCDVSWATEFCESFVWKNISGGPLNCSKSTGYESTGGCYIPFANGLCIGMIELDIQKENWFASTERNAEGVFVCDGKHIVWKTQEDAINAFNDSFVQYHSHPIAGSTFTKGLVGFWNDTIAGINGYAREGASSEYFNRRVLRTYRSPGMLHLGIVHWDLALCLLAAWVIVFLSLIKGIKSSGKVVYFTAIFPYAILLTLMVRGALLEGSLEGVLYYIRGYGTHEADVPVNSAAFYAEKLGNIAVWKAAAEQIFFSLSTCFGGLIALSSYNRFHNNIYRDALIVAFGNCLTSFFAGFVIFSYLGALAKKLGVRVSKVASSGIGLAFVVYPEAVTHIPPVPVWSFLFFFMLLTLGLDSEFTLMETLLTSLLDAYPELRPRKTWCIAGICFLFYLFGLSMCSSGGIYVLVLLDTFGAGWNVLLIAVLECIALAWVYAIIPHLTGANPGAVSRIVDDIQVMLGTDTLCGFIPWVHFRWFWMFMWSMLTPAICLVLILLSLVDYGKQPPLSYGSYKYEAGFIVLGWLITALIVILICIGAALALRESNYSIVKACQPSRYWGPALPRHRRLCTHHRTMEEDPWEKDDVVDKIAKPKVEEPNEVVEPLLPVTEAVIEQKTPATGEAAEPTNQLVTNAEVEKPTVEPEAVTLIPPVAAETPILPEPQDKPRASKQSIGSKTSKKTNKSKKASG